MYNKIRLKMKTPVIFKDDKFFKIIEKLSWWWSFVEVKDAITETNDIFQIFQGNEKTRLVNECNKQLC